MLKKGHLKFIKKPQLLIYLLERKGYLKWISDEKMLKFAYWCHTGKKLNLETPKIYNEKIQWLKLNDRDPLYTMLVDKYSVRNYIEKNIGNEYLIPLLGTWDNVEDIDFDNLPNEFVLKSTHDSGGVIVCRDKAKLNITEAKKILKKSQKQNYFWGHREWVYKNVKPRIIAEKLMVDESGTELKDYKFFCFNGKVKALFIASDRQTETKFDYFDKNFERINVRQKYSNSHREYNKPESFEKMIELAEKLSQGFKHLRVDFYDINGSIYFGELTFYHFSGWVNFEPDFYDEIFGEWLELGHDIDSL